MGFFSGETESESQTDPWGPANGILQEHLNMVRGQDPWSVYGGQQLANFNNDQLLQQQGVRDYLRFQGNAGADSMYGAGQNMLGAGQQARGLYTDLIGQNAVQNTGPDMNIAMQAAYNPWMEQQIQQAASGVTQSLYENQMPGIAAYSGGSGNLGSSRRGLLEAAAMRDAGGRLADISSNMRSSAWSQGMNTANQIAQQNAQLAQQNQQMQYGAAGNLANMGMQGANMMGQAQSYWGQNNQMLGNVGQQLYDQQQRQYDLNSNNFYLGQSLPYQQAQMGVGIGMGPAQAFGTTTNTTPNGGTFGAIMGPLMSMGSAAMGAYAGGGAGR